MSTGRVQISARISPELAKRLGEATFAMTMTKNEIIVEALESYVNRKSVKDQVNALFKKNY